MALSVKHFKLELESYQVSSLAAYRSIAEGLVEMAVLGEAHTHCRQHTGRHGDQGYLTAALPKLSIIGLVVFAEIAIRGKHNRAQYDQCAADFQQLINLFQPDAGHDMTRPHIQQHPQ